jgi:hypothetical protein
MTVSALSCFFIWSKYARLLKHGLAASTTAIVASSWGLKLGGALIGEVTRTPPYFGVWLAAGIARAMMTGTNERAMSDVVKRGRDIVTSATDPDLSMTECTGNGPGAQ